MDKRYQVFVSSTYEDLKEERQEVMHALLELDCIPSGMELFPATSEDQWTLIRQVIDDCDYYVVIVAGRYGSLAPDGVGYTEREYRYAVDRDKPVIAFLHKDPDSLPARKTEKTEKGQRQLGEFRGLLETRVCKYWSGAAELGSVVSRSVVQLMKSHPATGWVRADGLASEEASAEILRLRSVIEDLEAQIQRARQEPPKGTDGLAQGEDRFELHYDFTSVDPPPFGHAWDKETHEGTVSVTWNDLFAALAPLMIDEADESRIGGALNTLVGEVVQPELRRNKIFHRKVLADFRVAHSDFQTVKVQLRALGLIVQSVRKRSLKDTKTYWTLTPYGDEAMTRRRAMRRE